MPSRRSIAPARPAIANARRACAALAALLLAVIALGSLRAVPSDASTATQLAAIRERISDAQARAQQLTVDYENALRRAGELELAIAKTEARISKLDRRTGALDELVQQRALLAYMNGDAPPAWADTDSILESGRVQQFAEATSDHDTKLLDEYAEAGGDLSAQRAALQRDKDEQDAAVAAIAESSDELSAELNAMQDLQDDLEVKLAAEEAAQRREEQRRAAEARRQAEAARRAATSTTQAPATTTTSSSNGSGGSGATTTTQPTPTTDSPSTQPPTTQPPTTTTTQPDNGGGGGGVLGVAVCPISGPLSFIDSWHYPRPGGRLHEGVDLMSPSGTANVAVTSGTIVQDYGSLQGNGVKLYGDNGHLYYYFHLSSYAGSPRRVSTGEVVGYTGNTGNAVGGPTHTHFEIHPYGGGPVNPYPAAAAAC